MTIEFLTNPFEAERSKPTADPGPEPELSRRAFVQLLGAGILITVTEGVSFGQRRGGRRGARNVAARLHINQDGTITVMTGKVEEGQGSRAQLTQAAAEELRVGAAKINLVMADTALVPDDGITAGSRTTPRTVPAVRSGAATARKLLTDLAARRWNVDRDVLDVKDGTITHKPTGRSVGYADLSGSPEIAEAFQREYSFRRYRHAGRRVEGDWHIGRPAQPSRPGNGRPPLPLGYCPAWDALRESASPALVWGDARVDRSLGSGGDEGRGRGAG